MQQSKHEQDRQTVAREIKVCKREEATRDEAASSTRETGEKKENE
jgi:hypothetical protein